MAPLLEHWIQSMGRRGRLFNQGSCFPFPKDRHTPPARLLTWPCLTWEAKAEWARLKTVILAESRPEPFLPLIRSHRTAVCFSPVPSLVLQPSLWSCGLPLGLLLSSLLVWVSWRPHNDTGCFGIRWKRSTLGAAVDRVTQGWGMEREGPDGGCGKRQWRTIHKTQAVDEVRAGWPCSASQVSLNVSHSTPEKIGASHPPQGAIVTTRGGEVCILPST